MKNDSCCSQLKSCRFIVTWLSDLNIVQDSVLIIRCQSQLLSVLFAYIILLESDF